jgi:hypothetical protein
MHRGNRAARPQLELSQEGRIADGDLGAVDACPHAPSRRGLEGHGGEAARPRHLLEYGPDQLVGSYSGSRLPLAV